MRWWLVLLFATFSVPAHAQIHIFKSGLEDARISGVELSEFPETSLVAAYDLDEQNGVIELYGEKSATGSLVAYSGLRYIARDGGDVSIMIDGAGRPVQGVSNRDLRKFEFSNFTETTVTVKTELPDGTSETFSNVPYDDVPPATLGIQVAGRAMLIFSSATSTSGMAKSGGQAKHLPTLIGIVALVAYSKSEIDLFGVKKILKQNCLPNESAVNCAYRVIEKEVSSWFKDPASDCRQSQPPASLAKGAPSVCRQSPDFNAMTYFNSLTAQSPGCRAFGQLSGATQPTQGVYCTAPIFGAVAFNYYTRIFLQSNGAVVYTSIRTGPSDGWHYQNYAMAGRQTANATLQFAPGPSHARQMNFPTNGSGKSFQESIGGSPYFGILYNCDAGTWHISKNGAMTSNGSGACPINPSLPSGLTADPFAGFWSVSSFRCISSPDQTAPSC